MGIFYIYNEFIKKRKKKKEILEEINKDIVKEDRDDIDLHILIYCSTCGNPIGKNSMVYCFMDKQYCSENCRDFLYKYNI